MQRSQTSSPGRAPSGRGSATHWYVRKRPRFFKLPHLCPEPVLANASFSIRKLQNSAVFLLRSFTRWPSTQPALTRFPISRWAQRTPTPRSCARRTAIGCGLSSSASHSLMMIDTLKEPALFMCMCSCCFHKQRAQTISTSMCALGATKACAGLSAVTGLRTSRRCHPATCRFRDESGAGKRSSLILTLSNRKTQIDQNQDRRTKSEAEECLLQAKNAVRFGRGTDPSIQQRRSWRCRGAPKPWLAAQQPPLYDGHRDP